MLMTPHTLTDNARWDAVVSRDADVAGPFVYAVGSTGIYCRPGCPSRQPRRDRVRFFDTPADAERAGFRACLKCRPDATARDPWRERIARACRYLATAEHPSLGALAKRIGGSPYHIHRNFKRLVGITPRQYAEACRLGTVRRQLRAAGTVTDAMLDAGYGSSGRFYERAVPRLGMTPRAYRAGAPGVRIGFAIVASPAGRLLVAGTDRGICQVALGSSDRELQAHLAREYPQAHLEGGDERLAAWTNAILAHLDGRQPQLDLPLDVKATAFQWQVWNALAAIPYGEMRTYKDVASAIGRPAAVRAVARACATNPVALAIPCHRVVPADGTTGGYRWGAARKKALLARERTTILRR
jgi:AraC family transcriptional regulator of adaptative response/methylated-DNA-[protein]-cysteine methyltransferase